MNIKSTVLKSIKFVLNLFPKSLTYNLLKKQKMQNLDLSKIELIKQESQENLSNIDFLEKDLLLKLGLNNERNFQFPEELDQFYGRGLFYWQYPKQFSKYLVQLSKFNIESYLEIGVRHGGTFIITVEYLQRFNDFKKALGIDICEARSLFEYQKINPKINFKRIASQADEFKELIKNSEKFDLILIDGDHDEEPVRKDFELLKDKARIIVLHDIISDACPGVVKVWNEIKEKYNDIYDFYEFIDQYDSVQKRTGERYLGIGVAVRK